MTIPVCATAAPTRAWIFETKLTGALNQRLGIAERLVDRVDVLELPDPELQLPIEARAFVKRTLGARRVFKRYWPDLVVHTEPWSEEADFLFQLRRLAPKPLRLIRAEDTNYRREEWDLVLNGSAEPRKPGPNVLHVTGVATRITPGLAEAEALRWAERLGAFPRPITLVALGGSMDFLPYLPEWAVDLRVRLMALHRRIGGSVFVMASRRTPEPALAALVAELEGAPFYVYEGRRDGPDNPYLAALHMADRVIATGDSLSMMSDALVLGKPLFVHSPAWSLEARHQRMTEDLYLRGLARPFVGDEIEARGISPVDVASDVAREVRARFCEFELTGS